MTSKERAALRAQANTIETTLTVGKGGVSETVIAETEKLLDCHELVKGHVLESAMLTAREASDALCEATGADGIQTVGSKFVIWRKSEKAEQKKEKTAAPAKQKTEKKRSGNYNPVKLGLAARKAASRQKKQERDQYFHDQAVQAAIARRKQQAEDAE